MWLAVIVEILIVHASLTSAPSGSVFEGIYLCLRPHRSSQYDILGWEVWMEDVGSRPPPPEGGVGRDEGNFLWSVSAIEPRNSQQMKRYVPRADPLDWGNLIVDSCWLPSYLSSAGCGRDGGSPSFTGPQCYGTESYWTRKEVIKSIKRNALEEFARTRCLLLLPKTRSGVFMAVVFSILRGSSSNVGLNW